jgi:hypothetical protein
MMMRKIFSLVIVLFFCFAANKSAMAQNTFTITGKIFDSSTNKPLANVTVNLKGSKFSGITRVDGTFKIVTANWHDSLVITNVGFENISVPLMEGKTTNLVIKMLHKVGGLDVVVIGGAKKSSKTFMQKVIEKKSINNPARFSSFSYLRYTRTELDVNNLDFANSNGKGLKSMLLKTYASLDSNAKSDKELPVYFTERLANYYHSNDPSIDRENIIARKSLGLETDDLINRTNKYFFNFNIYEDWIPVFDQTYVSPLNSNAFSYYKYFEGDTTVENGETFMLVRFAPLRGYGRTFTGSLYVNTKTYVVQFVNLHLTKTANINFINDISYTQEYKNIYDSTSGKMVFLPYKFSSDVKFESGLALIGIPQKEKATSAKFIIRNTTVIDKMKLNIVVPNENLKAAINKEQTTEWDKDDKYWEANRPDQLSKHEKNIYLMIDTLKKNKRFVHQVKFFTILGSGYWDVKEKIRFGPYAAIISRNALEGLRSRFGFWTLPGFSKKLNIFGYGAYGTKDKAFKGSLGIKYLWNGARWTKTTVSYGSDYDLFIDQDDELDKDNIVNTLLRKNISFTRTYAKTALIKHEQYITPSLSLTAALVYKDLAPAFEFRYRPINTKTKKPYEVADSIFSNDLSVAEGSIGFRIAKNENSKLINFDQIKMKSYNPILSGKFTYGFDFKEAHFQYQKLNISLEQYLRLPPKSLLYYKVEAGKVFGTLPYLILDVPAGNEFLVSSKYLFNTMVPYEFASDQFVALHTRLYLGGILFDKIPFIRKLGWRERFTFNAYSGSLTDENKEYNKGLNFRTLDRKPFMEAGVGIENIFHFFAIEYYRRFSYSRNGAKRDGIYAGVTLSF